MQVGINLLSGLLSSNLCLLPNNIFKDLELSKETIYKLHVGLKSHDCIFESTEEEGNKAFFSTEIIEKLFLPKDIELNIWKRNNDIYLGPVVGIFINSTSLFKIYKNQEVIDRFKHIEASFKAQCIAYYFSVNSINWQENTIYGYTYNLSEKKWVGNWFPLPNVIYDRGAYFSNWEIPFAKYIKHQLRNVFKIPFINTFSGLPKWKSHVKLSKYPAINAYLPMTIRYHNFNEVMFMIEKFNFIFLKTTLGCRGKEVVSIKKVDNKYKLNYFWKGLQEVLLDNLDDLMKFVKNFTRKKTVIIQQGINLLKHEGHNMDLRIIMVKDENGNWKGTNVRSRIAKGSQTITNRCAGGEIYNYENIYASLKDQYSTDKIPSKDMLIDTAKFILPYIEYQFGRLGEIGMDLAIDENFKIWFIEGNPKLDKIPFEGLDDLSSIWPPALAIFEYAKFLTKMQ
jgi:hypothetical protein